MRRQLVFLAAMSVVLPVLYLYARPWLPLFRYIVISAIGTAVCFVGIDAVLVLSGRRRARAAARSEA